MAHALVFGASGVAGWSVICQLLEGYPEKGRFAKATAIFNRSMTFEETHWPTGNASNVEIQVLSGIDLTKTNSAEVTASIKEKITDIGSVTHVYYFAYKASQELKDESEINGRMLQNVLDALRVLSPNLEFVALLTGAKAYGVAVEPVPTCKPPFTESMSLPDELRKDLFYTKYREILTEASKGQRWTWCDIRPGLIVGFDPHGSNFNLAAYWGKYLTTWALVHGRGAKVPFPGIEAAYHSSSNNASADIVAKSAIWASLHPENCGQGEAFNIADEARTTTFHETWPAMCEYFGLVGVSPVEGGVTKVEEFEPPSVFLKKHEDVWEKAMGSGRGGAGTSEILDMFGVFLSFDMGLDVGKIRKAGFVEESDHVKSWYKVWDKFKKAGILRA